MKDPIAFEAYNDCLEGMEDEKYEACVLRKSAALPQSLRDKYKQNFKHLADQVAEQNRVGTIWRIMHDHDVHALDPAYNRMLDLCAKGQGDPAIGMSEREVVATSWCFPISGTDTVTTDGHYQMWAYTQWRRPRRGSGGDAYLYFKNGLLSRIERR